VIGSTTAFERSERITGWEKVEKFYLEINQITLRVSSRPGGRRSAKLRTMDIGFDQAAPAMSDPEQKLSA
jgi:hypothetical protein